MTSIGATTQAFVPTTAADPAASTDALTQTSNATALPSADASAPPVPLYAAVGSAFGTGLYGLRAPSNPEDAAIVLAQIALALDTANTENRRQKLEGLLGGVRNGLGGVGAVIVGTTAQIDAKTALKATAETKLATAVKERGELEAERTKLNGTITELTRTIADTSSELDADKDELALVTAEGEKLDGEITGFEKAIADLDARIAAAEKSGDTAGAEKLGAEKAQVSDKLRSAGNERAKVGERAEELTGNIADLKAEIDAAQTDLDAAKASLAAVGTKLEAAIQAAADAQVEIVGYTAEIAALSALNRALNQVVTALFSQLALASRAGAGDTVLQETHDANFDYIFDEVDAALDALREAQIGLGEEAGRTAEAAQEDADRLRGGQRDGQARLPDAREPQAPEARRAAGLAVALAAGLADLMAVLASLDAEGLPAAANAVPEPQPFRLAI